MKNQLILMMAFLAVVVSACADGGGFTGRILYTMEYELPEAYESQRSMLATEMTTFIGKGFTRQEQKTGLGDQTTINNLKTKETIILMNLMGQKIAISTADSGPKDAPKPIIEVSEETKVIAGYICKKAIYKISNAKGEESSFVVYYAEEISPESNTQFPGLGGFPLEYVIEAQGMVITYKAKEVIKEKVSADLSKVPSGYEKMTYQEFMKMMGGE